jgi:hypothetical protein
VVSYAAIARRDVALAHLISCQDPAEVSAPTASMPPSRHEHKLVLLASLCCSGRLGETGSPAEEVISSTKLHIKCMVTCIFFAHQLPRVEK